MKSQHPANRHASSSTSTATEAEAPTTSSSSSGSSLLNRYVGHYSSSDEESDTENGRGNNPRNNSNNNRSSGLSKLDSEFLQLRISNMERTLRPDSELIQKLNELRVDDPQAYADLNLRSLTAKFRSLFNNEENLRQKLAGMPMPSSQDNAAAPRISPGRRRYVKALRKRAVAAAGSPSGKPSVSVFKKSAPKSKSSSDNGRGKSKHMGKVWVGKHETTAKGTNGQRPDESESPKVFVFGSSGKHGSGGNVVENATFQFTSTATAAPAKPKNGVEVPVPDVTFHVPISSSSSSQNQRNLSENHHERPPIIPPKPARMSPDTVPVVSGQGKEFAVKVNDDHPSADLSDDDDGDHHHHSDNDISDESFSDDMSSDGGEEVSSGEEWLQSLRVEHDKHRNQRNNDKGKERGSRTATPLDNIRQTAAREQAKRAEQRVQDLLRKRSNNSNDESGIGADAVNIEFEMASNVSVSGDDDDDDDDDDDVDNGTLSNSDYMSGSDDNYSDGAYSQSSSSRSSGGLSSNSARMVM